MISQVQELNGDIFQILIKQTIGQIILFGGLNLIMSGIKYVIMGDKRIGGSHM